MTPAASTRRLPLLLALVLTGCAPAQTRWAADLPFTPGHTAHLRVGLNDIVFQFSEWPIRARKSLDIVFAPSAGDTSGLDGRLALFAPAGHADADFGELPRYVRDRQFWGLDSRAFPVPGVWSLSLTVGGQTARLPIVVGPEPAGPPAGLISALALAPLALLVALILRAWWRVRPLRQPDSRHW